jgi:hypothetical protein
MTSFFDTIKNDLKSLEKSILGPDYRYYKMIKSPEEMGMSDKGTLGTITDNITGLIGYINLLAVGGGTASKVDGPLGSRFFLETGAKCRDVVSGNQVQRSIYFDFIPDGSLPFISSVTGIKFKPFEGIVPGVMSNLAHVHPSQLFNAFGTGGNPPCSAVTLSVRDEANIPDQYQTAFITLDDQKNISALNEDFSTLSDVQKQTINMPNDPLVKIYYSALALLGLYILMRLLKKKSI